MYIPRLFYSISAVLLLMFAISGDASAQTDRNYLYLFGKAGATSYHGDLTSVNDHHSMFDFGFSGGFGYAFTPVFSLRTEYRVGEYPRTDRLNARGYFRRHNAGLHGVLNLVPSSPVSPYLLGGVSMTFFGTFDKDPNFDPAFGPVLGAGFDFALSDRFSFFVEGVWDFVADDYAMDEVSGDTGFDVMGYIGGGFRMNLRSSFKPVRAIRISGPAEMVEREEEYFSVALVEAATEPVSYEWDFGDGVKKFGAEVSHRYAEPGDYTITVIASNRRSEVERSMNVRVDRAAIPARIVSVRADERQPEVQQPVRFTAVIEGTQPVLVEWNFGDGTTSNELSASHAYAEAGAYQAVLTVNNVDVAGDDGVHSRTLTIEVREPEPAFPELRVAHFAFNSSYFDDQTRANMLENAKMLREHPDACVIITGYTDDTGTPTYNEWLSERRAERIQELYIQNGVQANRIRIDGKGVAPEPCPDGSNACRENRRAESVMVECW